MEKIYIVKYSTGSYDDYCVNDVFATENKKLAISYTKKFNKIVKKWMSYFHQFEETKYGFNWIKDEYVERYFDRWNSLRCINDCFYEEIEVR